MIWLYIAMGFLFVGCCCWRTRKKVDVSTQTDKRVSFVIPAIIDNYATATDDTEKASAGARRRRRFKRMKTIIRKKEVQE